MNRAADADVSIPVKGFFYCKTSGVTLNFITCALKHKSPLMTLDNGLIHAAARAGVNIKEVTS